MDPNREIEIEVMTDDGPQIITRRAKEITSGELRLATEYTTRRLEFAKEKLAEGQRKLIETLTANQRGDDPGGTPAAA